MSPAPTSSAAPDGDVGISVDPAAPSVDDPGSADADALGATAAAGALGVADDVPPPGAADDGRSTTNRPTRSSTAPAPATKTAMTNQTPPRSGPDCKR